MGRRGRESYGGPPVHLGTWRRVPEERGGGGLAAAVDPSPLLWRACLSDPLWRTRGSGGTFLDRRRIRGVLLGCTEKRSDLRGVWRACLIRYTWI